MRPVAGRGCSPTGAVDYERAAPTYRAGRELEAATLRRWGRAVGPWLSSHRRLTVLDLGAGTGIFARAWRRWCDCRLVAVEPAAAMRALAAQAGLPDRVTLVAGTAEELPLRDASVDVAWLSTVFHHLRDRPSAGDQLRRVVRPGGVVLVRSFFPGHSEIGWLRFFPPADAVRARFPSVAQTRAALQSCGFATAQLTSVAEPGGTVADVVTWVRRMRGADSLLGCFDDGEFARGLAALEANAPDEVVGNRLSLLVMAG